MLNIFRFIFRYYLFILFLLIQFFCFWLAYRFHTYHETFFISRAHVIAASVHRFNMAIEQYLSLQKVNDSLALHNARLLSQVVLSQTQDAIQVDSVKSVNLSKKYTQVYSYLNARVVRNSVSGMNNIIFINKGKKQGVHLQMGVISDQGVVGQVVSVTEHYAAVLSQLNRKFRTSARLKGSGYFGNLLWDGTDPQYASLDEIPKHIQLKAGDSVVTSGYSELYPADIMIGRVHSVRIHPESNFADIKVKLAVDFRRLDYVYVVINKRRDELRSLDSLTQKYAQ